MQRINYLLLRAPIIVALIVAAIMALIVSSSGIALKIVKNNAPIVHASMEMQYELSLFHLWLEEFIQQDPTVDKEMIWQHLNQARNHAYSILNSDIAQTDQTLIIKDPALTPMLNKILDQIALLEEIALTRLERSTNILSGSSQDQEFDEIYTATLNIADDVKKITQQNMMTDVTQFEYRVYIVRTLVLLIGLMSGVLFFLYERRRNTDYTKLLGSKEELAHKQTLLEEAQAMAHIGNWELDPVTMKAVWSDEVFRILGIEKTDNVGTELLATRLHPDDRETTLSSMQCAVAEGRKHHIEYRIIRPDGEVRWLECQAEQQYDNSGNLLKLRGVVQDITQRKLDELNLQQSEARFRKLFENTDAISVQGYDRDRRVIYWNRASELLYGYTANEAKGRPLEELIIPDNMRDQVISGLSAWMDKGREIPSSELTLRKADGSQVQVFSSHVMFRNNNDEPEIYCIDIDLTKLKRAESQARQVELVLDSVFQALPDLFFLMDPDGTIKEYRAQQSDDLYVPPERFLGKRMQDLLPPSLASQFEYNMALIRAGDELVTYEYEMEVPHGIRQYEARLCQLPDSPQLISVVRDITEQKRAEKVVHDSEERYRTIFEGAPEGVWLIGSDRKTIEVNRRLSEILGYPREEMIGKTPFDFVDEDNRKILTTQTEKIETTERREYEISLRHKDGHNVPTFFSATTLRSTTGEVLEAVAFVTDLTDQKTAEKALRRAQKMDAIGQLTGGIAHDFNNILAVILGNLSLFERLITDDEKALKRINSMKKAGQRAADLTKQLLSFSRRQATQQSITNINPVIEGMESLITRSLTPEVEMVYQFADKLWLTEIDPGDFEDALLNLCINARDAMAGHGHLTIETHNATIDASYCVQNPGSSPGNYVELAVSDTGEGIPLEQQEHIFEPFYTTKEQGKGTGLGLSMVFGFVQRSGGFINVYSELGIGTTFRIYLPRIEGEEPSDETDLKQNETLPQGTETLLIVDDEIDLLDLAKESLEELGYKIQTASDGLQALEQLAKEPTIDLLFSDVVMPGGINGYELAEQACNNYPRLKVLLTSGYSGKAMTNNRQEQTTANLLSKPYTQAELAKRVRVLLDGEENK